MVDVLRLQKSWAAVAGLGDQVPLFFYSTLFLAHPEIRQMFPISMAHQRHKLVGALGHVVSQVDDLDALVPALHQLGRDHRKFGVTPGHYVPVGEALLATLEHFAGPEWDAELAADWAEAYDLVSQVMIEGAETSGGLPPWWDAPIVGVERPAPDVAVLTVAPRTPLPYKAGQSLAVEVPSRPRLWRRYTPASLPDRDGAFELHVRLVPGGQVSTALVQGSRPGDLLRLGAPVGTRLTLAPAAQDDILMLAGGTGLAPMKAMLAQLASEAGAHRRVHLIWGGRTQRDLYDLPAVERLCAQLDWLRLVPCVSGAEDAGDAGGAVQSGTVVDVALRSGPWTDHDIYVCGSPDMVEATRRGLAHAGLPDHRIRIEHFGNEEALT